MTRTLLIMLIPLISVAASVSLPETRAANRLSNLIEAYQKLYSEPVEAWRDLEKLDPGFEGLNSFLPEEMSIEECFVFIPLHTRTNFPQGELILISATSNAWPQAWIDNSFPTTNVVPERANQWRAAKERERPIRHLVYRDKRGRMRVEWWSEERVQSTLGAADIIIPSVAKELLSHSSAGPLAVRKPIERPSAPPGAAYEVNRREERQGEGEPAIVKSTSVPQKKYLSSRTILFIVLAVLSLLCMAFLTKRRRR